MKQTVARRVKLFLVTALETISAVSIILVKEDNKYSEGLRGHARALGCRMIIIPLGPHRRKPTIIHMGHNLMVLFLPF